MCRRFFWLRDRMASLQASICCSTRCLFCVLDLCSLYAATAFAGLMLGVMYTRDSDDRSVYDDPDPLLYDDPPLYVDALL